jgi:hypothetical protein
MYPILVHLDQQWPTEPPARKYFAHEQDNLLDIVEISLYIGSCT